METLFAALATGFPTIRRLLGISRLVGEPVFAGLDKGNFREPSADVDASPLLVRNHVAAQSGHLFVAREIGLLAEPELPGNLLKARNNILADVYKRQISACSFMLFFLPLKF